MTRGNLPPDLLRALIAVSETGSQTQAAERIGLSRSAVGSQIKRLQSLVGDPLFEKTATGIGLTEVGQLALDLARQAIAVNDTLLRLSEGGGVGQRVRLGISSMLLDFFSRSAEPSLIGKLAVTSDNCRAIAKAFDEQRVDVAMVLDARDHRSILGDSLVAEFRIDFAWIQTRDFVLVPGKPIPLATWPADQAIFLNELLKAGLPYRLAFSSPDYFSKFSAVRSGQCLTVVPRKAIAPPFVEADGYDLPAIAPKKMLLGVRGDPTSHRFRPVVSALSALDLAS